MDLVVVGTVALDTIESPHGRVDRVLGGSASYASVAASRWRSTAVVSVVGRDFPDSARHVLQSANINLDGLHVDPVHRSQFWHGRYHADMNFRDHVAVDLDIIDAWNPPLPESLRPAKVVFLAHNRPQNQLHTLCQFAGPEFVIADTIDYWIQTQRDALLAVLKRVHLLIINDQEARELAEVQDLFRAAERIQQFGPQWLLIKKGEHGAMLIGPDLRIALPAVPVRRVVDPTGAGDSFAGGFLGRLLHSSPDDPRRWGNALAAGIVTASFTVEGFGISRLASVPASEYHERYESFRAMLALDPTPRIRE
ncbi:PfkB family carbohydrate kinase [Tuwongella immobilis]|uniref:Carbohydrate kinase PfkB domain-containing protein n=1 Tax=Tuwongella immobilis TaxID=692036 RepID=A0A6C2YS23_9BACT|nr:PfkB family carbohydrate kinase [Tuwongella immobilis]VIP03682.1 sugar kinase : Carbohydrate kinase, PfkB family OS=Bizionia argentinensis JUB59 GN=BZARG_1129 PE=4 SV=1: PfkB [Tuwongella immobilis]VTS04732.1 sugar kinase : Carbohydrate kinase, PfkB family OS=Bizionia argentinensis JUB59 GN=BZARG_1129 PE=4 SV=1: PfkB [Tuwongella immobilis]